MSDVNLMIFGIVVFGLMLTGAVLTVLEFRQISDQGAAKAGSEPDQATPHLTSQDRD